MPSIHQRHRRTDGRTDGRTTYDSNTALALRASRGKNVDDECRHDMRPSIQLSSVSGVDSKLGLTMVRCSLQSVPELPALDPPPLSKHDARLLWRFLTSSDLDLWPFNWKLAFHLLVTMETFIPILIFLCFLSSSYDPVRDRRIERRTDRRTGKNA